MRRPLHWWLCWWATFAAIDLWRDSRQDGSTLSQCTRELFRTHTPLGRLMFTAAFGTGSLVLYRHVVKS